MKSPISVLKVVIFVFAVLAVCAFGQAGYAETLARITVDNAEHSSRDAVVSAALEGISAKQLAGGVKLMKITDSGKKPVVSQVEPGSPPRLWWVMSGNTPPGSKVVYELLEGARRTTGAIKVTKNDKFLDIQAHGRKVLRYNHAPVPPPEGKDPLYTRSAFIHPLWSPKGAVLTNIHPADHIHHLGIWMPWTHTKFEGKEVDFWNLARGQGTVRFVKFLSTTSGPVFGGFKAEHEHVALQTARGEKVVLRETWDVRVYNTGRANKDSWLIDFVSRQTCVADSPLHQDKYRYGGFGFRAAAEWTGDRSAYLTSEGKTGEDGHATRARWCDTSGQIGKDWQGITFYSHPENFQHPEPMRIWPTNMKQVFFNWAPSQAGDWEMKPGVEHVFRYRLYVHEGKVNVDRVEQVWDNYAKPPKVTLEKPGGRSERIALFDGTDFKHWTSGSDKPVEWVIQGDTMTIKPRSGNILTKQKFRDFKMHLEFKTPLMPPNVKGQGRGNSGVYIQQRYEIQILDSYGLELQKNDCASIYRFRAPDKNVCKKPNEWQEYDIIFQAARFDGKGPDAKKTDNVRITLRHNGVLVHDDVEVPNKTGAGQPEGPEDGQIKLQNHGNEVSFRNIWIEPL